MSRNTKQPKFAINVNEWQQLRIRQLLANCCVWPIVILLWWQEIFPRTAIRLRPSRHDVNEMLTAGDPIADWLARAS
jgi:hypothetical protein